jgi:hypothetical protein
MGPIGLTGAKGDTGATGPQGPPGPAGLAGVAVEYKSIWEGRGLDYSDNPVSAFYIKNGPLIHFRIHVSARSVRNFGTGEYTVTLPFKVASYYVFRDGAIDTRCCQPNTCPSINCGPHDYYQISGAVDTDDYVLRLMYPSNTRDNPMDHNSPVKLGTEDSFYISGTYETTE